jgi:hypothetical protein
MPIVCVHAPKARRAEQAPCQVTAARMTARRLTISAITPAGSVNRNRGVEAAVAIRESK